MLKQFPERNLTLSANDRIGSVLQKHFGGHGSTVAPGYEHSIKTCAPQFPQEAHNTGVSGHARRSAADFVMDMRRTVYAQDDIEAPHPQDGKRFLIAYRSVGCDRKYETLIPPCGFHGCPESRKVEQRFSTIEMEGDSMRVRSSP